VALDELHAALAPRGLRVRGGFPTDSTLDRDLLAVAPWARTLVLIGNVGSELWEKSGAEIAALIGANPLDRWTEQVIDPVAHAIEGTAVYPFNGPPYWPFQRWAERADGVRASPVGIQIHPEYGLWHAYRAALLLPTAIAFPPVMREHPCDTCKERPCLTRCPVKAFSAAGYDAESCIAHVVASQHEPGSCSSTGCLARLACPVGAEWRYRPAHARFHMAAFVAARARASERNS
jgi:hypothetical protein